MHYYQKFKFIIQMVLQAQIHTTIQLCGFRNVDLYNQGYYHIRCRLYKDYGQEGCVLANPINLEFPSVNGYINGVGQKYPIGAKIDNQSGFFHSHTFHIRYCEEEFDISDICVFSLSLDAFPGDLYAFKHIFLEVDLMFSEDVEITSIDEMSTCSHVVIELSGIESGICTYIPVRFDESHFGLCNMNIVSNIIGYTHPILPATPYPLSPAPRHQKQIITPTSDSTMRSFMPDANELKAFQRFVFSSLADDLGVRKEASKSAWARGQKSSIHEADNLARQYMTYLTERFIRLAITFQSLRDAALSPDQIKDAGEAMKVPPFKLPAEEMFQTINTLKQNRLQKEKQNQFQGVSITVAPPPSSSDSQLFSNFKNNNTGNHVQNHAKAISHVKNSTLNLNSTPPVPPSLGSTRNPLGISSTHPLDSTTQSHNIRHQHGRMQSTAMTAMSSYSNADVRLECGAPTEVSADEYDVLEDAISESNITRENQRLSTESSYPSHQPLGEIHILNSQQNFNKNNNNNNQPNITSKSVLRVSGKFKASRSSSAVSTTPANATLTSNFQVGRREFNSTVSSLNKQVGFRKGLVLHAAGDMHFHVDDPVYPEYSSSSTSTSISPQKTKNNTKNVNPDKGHISDSSFGFYSNENSSGFENEDEDGFHLSKKLNNINNQSKKHRKASKKPIEEIASKFRKRHHTYHPSTSTLIQSNQTASTPSGSNQLLFPESHSLFRRPHGLGHLIGLPPASGGGGAHSVYSTPLLTTPTAIPDGNDTALDCEFDERNILIRLHRSPNFSEVIPYMSSHFANQLQANSLLSGNGTSNNTPSFSNDVIASALLRTFAEMSSQLSILYDRLVNVLKIAKPLATLLLRAGFERNEGRLWRRSLSRRFFDCPSFPLWIATPPMLTGGENIEDILRRQQQQPIRLLNQGDRKNSLAVTSSSNAEKLDNNAFIEDVGNMLMDQCEINLKIANRIRMQWNGFNSRRIVEVIGQHPQADAHPIFIEDQYGNQQINCEMCNYNTFEASNSIMNFDDLVTQTVEQQRQAFLKSMSFATAQLGPADIFYSESFATPLLRAILDRTSKNHAAGKSNVDNKAKSFQSLPSLIAPSVSLNTINRISSGVSTECPPPLPANHQHASHPQLPSPLPSPRNHPHHSLGTRKTVSSGGILIPPPLGLERSVPSSLPANARTLLDNRYTTPLPCAVWQDAACTFPSPSNSAKMSPVASSLRGKMSSTHGNMNTGVHYIFFVHGFQGTSFDMRLVKSVVNCMHDRVKCVASTSNEDKTEDSFLEMGKRLAVEVTSYLDDYGMPSGIRAVSFVGHSMGGLTIRACIPHLSAEIQSRLHSFVSLSTPHLGYAGSSASKLVDTGMWIMKQFGKNISLKELSYSDAADIKDTALYKIANNGALAHFKHILLTSSSQDSYSPYESARIEMPAALVHGTASEKAIAAKKCPPYLIDIAKSCLEGVRRESLIRLDVSFRIQERTVDTYIGRAAHILFLESMPLLEAISVCYAHLFK